MQFEIIQEATQRGQAIMDLARSFKAFMIRRFTLRRQLPRSTVLNHELLFGSFNYLRGQRTTYIESHGADVFSYVGSRILYFAIPYMLKAQTCVCIGSGGGYVPRFMYHAQVEAKVQGGRTILIDANKGAYGRPDYLNPGSPFRRRFSAIEIVEMDSADYAAVAKNQNIVIDYLHIDGDHSYEGVLSDFTKYLPLMSNKGLITVHDTCGNHPCAAVIPAIKGMGHEVINLSQIGEGVAIIKASAASQCGIQI